MSLKLTFAALLLVIYFDNFRHVSCNEQLENNYKLSQISGTGISYQQTTYNNAPDFAQQQQGYNYITPASKYKTFSPPMPEHHTSQTAPLALSLHPDDYEKFDKTEQTFFIPRTRNLPKLGNDLNTKMQFYVPRTNVQQNEISAENKETTNGPATGVINKAEYQRNWTPLTVAEDPTNFYKQQRFYKQVLPSQQDATLPLQYAANFVNLSYDSKADFKNYTTINEISNLKALPTQPDKSFTTSCAQTSQSIHQTNAAQLLQPLQMLPTAEASVFAPNLLNKQNEYSANLERQRRLQVLRSLLAEYLALTLQSTPEAATFEQTSTNLNPHSSASKNFGSNSLNDELQSAIIATQTPTTIAARKPHSIYGAPFLNYPIQSNTNSFQGKK